MKPLAPPKSQSLPRRWMLCVPLLLAAVASPAENARLPYDRTHPVIYDNDGAIESGFTDVYVMALASAGVIDLRGIITTGSYGEERRKPPFSARSDAALTRERQELVEKARRSGFRNLPDVVSGGSLSLRRPASGRIEDTRSYGSPGSRLVLQEARKASPAKPLVILMGGQATCVVDAYLQDNSIADRVVLAWIVGNKTKEGGVDSNEYNAGVDAWATYIAFERLRLIAFPFTNDGNDTNDGFAATPKSRLGELPDTELRQIMLEARWPRSATTFSEPHCDYDAVGAFPLTRDDYVRRTKRVAFSHRAAAPWDPGKQLLVFKEDPAGRALVVWEADPTVATQEWWRGAKDAAAWGPAAGRVPFQGTPWAVPGTIEAEHFDHGGTGRAYSDTTNNLSDAKQFNPIRFLEHVDILVSGTAGGGYAVGRTEPGEWLEYTVKTAQAGTYTMEVRVASPGPGGSFHVEIAGTDVTGPLSVPGTGGADAWQVLRRPGIPLGAGDQAMRLVLDSAGPAGEVGTFDWIRLEGPETKGRGTP